MRAISWLCANERLGAGRTQAESPEWTPASSTCCMTAATYVSAPSQSASTSTSTACSTKRSTRIRSNGGHLANLVGRVADAHRAAAEDVRGPDEHRVADPLGDLDRLVGRRRDPPLRRAQPVREQQAGEALAVLGEIDRVERRAEDPVAGILDRARELERRLAAELDHDAVGLLPLADREHRLGVERLEVEPVGRVVVGRDRLGVAVDHHRLVAELAVGRDGVDAAVVELDPLPDPVRAGA